MAKATDIKPEESRLPDNPWAEEESDALNVGAVAIEKSRAVAEVQTAILTAKRWPRNQAQAYESIMAACRRKGFAESARYAYKRGGQLVAGPTIRYMEMVCRYWGNVTYGLKELAVYNDEETEMLAYCWDLQTNTFSAQTFRAKHMRYYADGSSKKLSDPRDIYENNTSLGVRRMRSRMEAIIPDDIIQDGLAECAATVAGGSDVPLEQRMKNMVKKFGDLGIKVKHIEDRLQHQISDVLPEEYSDLVAIYNSLHDRQSNPSDWFAVPKTVTASERAQQIDKELMGEAKVETMPENVEEEYQGIFAEPEQD